MYNRLNRTEDEHPSYTSSAEKINKFSKIFTCVFIIGICISLLEIILAFIHNTHILGFILGLLLLFISLTSLILSQFFCSLASLFLQKKYNIRPKSPKIPKIFLIITVAIFALSLLVTSFLVIKILNFTTNPGMDGLPNKPFVDPFFNQGSDLEIQNLKVLGNFTVEGMEMIEGGLADRFEKIDA